MACGISCEVENHWSESPKSHWQRATPGPQIQIFHLAMGKTDKTDIAPLKNRSIWSRLDELLISSPGFRGQSLALVDQEKDPFHYAMDNCDVDQVIIT